MSKTHASSRRRLPRWLKLLIALALGVGLYAALGFWVAPAIVKSQLIKRLPEFTQREARVKKVAINPFALTITVSGLELVDPDGGLFAAFDVFHADLELASLWQRRFLLRDVTVQVPYLGVVRRADGSLDLLDLVPAADTNAPPSALPKALIQRLRILNGGLHFEDRTLTNAFATRIQPFHLFATNLSTLPGTNATFRLEATASAGMHVEVAGELTVLPEPAIRGSVRALLPRLDHFGGYVTQATGIAIEEGGLGVNTEFAVAMGKGGLSASLTNAVVELTKLAVRNPPELEPWFTLGRLKVTGLGGRVDLAALHEATVDIGRVEIDAPMVVAALHKDGRLSLLDLLPPPATNAAPTETVTMPQPLPSLLVRELALSNGSLRFTDETLDEPFVVAVEPFSISLTNLAPTLPTNATFRIEAQGSQEERVEITGTLTLVPQPAVTGFARIEAPNLPAYNRYLTPLSGILLDSGTVAVTAGFAATLTDGDPVVTVTNTAVSLRDFAVRNPDEQAPWVRLKAVDLQGASADLADEKVLAQSLLTDGVELHIIRRPDGSVNTEDIYLPGAIAEAIRNLTTWQVELASTIITNYSASFTDHAVAPPVALGVDQVWASISDFSNVPAKPMQVDLGLRWMETGAARAGLRGHLIPAAMAGDLTWTNLILTPFQPYVAQLAHLRLERGSVAGGLALDVALERTNAPVAQVTGQVQLDDFAATDSQAGRDILEVERVALTGIDIGAFPHSATFEELFVKGLRTSLVRMTNGQFNVLTLLKETPESPDAPGTNVVAGAEKHAAPTSVPPVRLNTLRIEDASLVAADEAIAGRFQTTVETVSGTIQGLSWPEVREVTIDLAGKLAEPAPFAIRGTVFPDPAAPHADLTVECSTADLTQLTPYSARYAGYPIVEGTATTTVRYQLDGRQLTGQNLVYLDRLSFGEKQDSPDAIKLPLKLGVSLLKDRNGRITLDVPISGTLDDPEFSIGRVVSQTVQNMITSAATAPFRMLGSLFGGGKDEDIQFVEFNAGESRLNPAALSKLGILGTALYERPQLRVAVIGGADPASDTAPLRQARLEAELRQLHATAGESTGSTNATSAPPRLTGPERDAALLRAYTNRFGMPAALLANVTVTNAVDVSPSTPPPDSAATEEIAPQPKAVTPASAPEPEPTLPTVARRTPRRGGAWLMELAARDRRGATATQERAEAEAPKPETTRANEPEPGAAAQPTEISSALPTAEDPAAPAVEPAPPLPTSEEMEAALLKSIEVTEADLVALKSTRAEAVRKQLLEDGRIDAGRVSTRSAGDDKAGSQPKVTFELE